jgi:hypothetical protein
MEVLIPHKDNNELPEFLTDFIENDPNFIPEIHCNNLEDAFMNMYTADEEEVSGNMRSYSALKNLKSGHMEE